MECWHESPAWVPDRTLPARRLCPSRREFEMASVDRGKVIYKEYCSQCHGATGKGDGPAASGLEPKPAIHANIPFEKLPIEYLYNVINHGGPAVGKSPNMPYWNLTIGQQGVADVIAYVKATFKGAPDMATAPSGGQGGVCVQPRKTAKAPDEFLTKTNPLPASAGTIQAGKALFLKTAQPVACAMCHGEQGDGKGGHGSSLGAAAEKLYLQRDDEGHSRWSTVLGHQEWFAGNGDDAVCRIAG